VKTESGEGRGGEGERGEGERGRRETGDGRKTLKIEK